MANHEVAAFLRELRGRGYTAKKARRSGHWIIRNPQGRIVTVTSGTPSDRRTLMNARKQIERSERA